jgi:hypothetical protein
VLVQLGDPLAIFQSVLRPGTLRMCAAYTRTPRSLPVRARDTQHASVRYPLYGSPEVELLKSETGPSRSLNASMNRAMTLP